MTQVNVLQKSFASGEISPEFEARSDIEDYKEGLSDSLNVLCTSAGDLIPRPGTEYINMTPRLETRQASNKARLIPFKYSETESYMFEFSEYNLQIYRNGKPLSWEPIAGGDTYETIQAAEYVHEYQYPIAGTNYGTESSRFVFVGEGSFQFEAGAGPFTISELDGNSIAGLQYIYPYSSGNVTETVTNQDLFWVHSVERGVIARNVNTTSKTYKGDAGYANTVVDKICDIVRLTWHPSYCEGGSAYDPDKCIYADSTTGRPAALLSTKWTFFTATIKSTVTSTTSQITTSDINYQSFFGSTDLAAGGERTSPIPYLQSDLNSLQYASSGDLTFITHPNYQPLKIIRTGTESFKVQNHYTIGGPWRGYATYPNTYWGGGGHLRNSPTAVLDGATGAGAAAGSAVDIRYTTDATDVLYLFKSVGTPDIITNADQTSNEADDVIVGRKIRICVPIGKQWWSENIAASATNIESWNTSDHINTRIVFQNASGGGSTVLRKETGLQANHLMSFNTFQSNFTPDSPVYIWMEGEVEALVNTVGSIKHKNPTSGFRVRITRGANFLRTGPDARWIGPSTRTKIGRLFEPEQPDQTGGWPRCVEIINNRLVYASNQESPTVLAFSAVGNFDDFTPDDYGFNHANTIDSTETANWSVTQTWNAETYDTNAFVYYLQEGFSDQINWLKATNYGLIAGTSSGIYLSPKLGYNEAYTPFNFDMRLISEEGCNQVPALFVDGQIFYINKVGDKLLSIEYVNDADGFRPRVESLLSEHLFESGIKAMAYARSPLNVLWLVTNDNNLISGVRLDTKNKLAFFKHKIASPSFNTKTYGEVNSIAVIPSEDLQFDQLWITCTRSLPWKGLNFSIASVHYGDPSGGTEAKYEVNTVERLTQYNFALVDDRDFIGLDCSVHNKSYYQGNNASSAISYANQYSILELLNYHNNSSDVLIQMKLNTVEGLSLNNDFIITGLPDELKYINYKSEKQIANVPNIVNKLISTTAEEDPNQYSSLGFINYNSNTRGFLIKPRLVYLPGRKYEQGTSYTTGLAFFTILNNFAFFQNGILELETFSHNEKGASGSLPVFALTPTVSGLYKSASAPDRVIYARANSALHTQNAFDNLIISGNTVVTYYNFVCGFKPEVYWTTLPPRINNQLGEADLSYTFMTSASINVKDAHQISVRNNAINVTSEKMIDNEYVNTDAIPLNVERRSGVYKTSLVQPEEDTRGRVRFENHSGYPFKLLEINLRGERATRG